MADDKEIGRDIAFNSQNPESNGPIGALERMMAGVAGPARSELTIIAALRLAGHCGGATGASLPDMMIKLREAYFTGQRAREIADRMGNT